MVFLCDYKKQNYKYNLNPPKFKIKTA